MEFDTYDAALQQYLSLDPMFSKLFHNSISNSTLKSYGQSDWVIKLKEAAKSELPGKFAVI